ncbi:hypothetical protein [Kitasatospora sp. NPDC090091]|uniref:hypothetical protein n=1 Tax=Kitasatospora sp. NPDC090091 TaxID=3364081 RepID=UPI003817A958
MCRRTVFLESFDSTRATSKKEEVDHPNRAQAQTEALLYLLLGHSLAVNNSYGSDSVSVLELVDAVLTTRDETIRRTKNPEARERLGQARPFIVTWFGAHSLLSAFTGQLRRVESKPYFRLSAWLSINDDVDRRRELADALDSADDNPHQLPATPTWLRAPDYEDLAKRFEILTRLAEYSRTPNAGFKAKPPTIGLDDYLEHFARLEQDELEETARLRNCPLDVATAIRDEITSQPPKSLRSRSWVHNLVEQSTSQNLGPLEWAREFVDTLYNAMLAESAGAQDGYLSSVPRADAREHLKQVNALALEVIRSLREGQGASARRLADRTISGVFTAAETLPGLPVTALHQLFTTYWALVADRERWQAWQESCARLNSLLDRAEARRAARLSQDRRSTTGQVDNQLRDTWAAHVNTLRTSLPGTLRGDGEGLAVGARHGTSSFGQLLQIEDLTPQVRADALAVGEHLSGLAAAVGQ